MKDRKPPTYLSPEKYLEVANSPKRNCEVARDLCIDRTLVHTIRKRYKETGSPLPHCIPRSLTLEQEVKIAFDKRTPYFVAADWGISVDRVMNLRAKHRKAKKKNARKPVKPVERRVLQVRPHDGDIVASRVHARPETPIEVPLVFTPVTATPAPRGYWTTLWRALWGVL